MAGTATFRVGDSSVRPNPLGTVGACVRVAGESAGADPRAPESCRLGLRAGGVAQACAELQVLLENLLEGGAGRVGQIGALRRAPE